MKQPEKTERLLFLTEKVGWWACWDQVAVKTDLSPLVCHSLDTDRRIRYVG